MIKLIKTAIADVQRGDVLFRVDDGFERAMLIGEFVEWIIPLKAMKVYNPAIMGHDAVTDIPETMLVLEQGEGASSEPELKETQRGFTYFEMTDSYGKEFTIQKSSSAEEEKIWMGVDDDRAHLTRDMVRRIIPILQQFADTGEVGTPGTIEPSPLEQEWLKIMDEIAGPVLEATIALLKIAQEY